MNKQIEEIKKLAETLRLIDELQFDPNYTLSYQRAICLNKTGYRKVSDVAREIFEEIEKRANMDYQTPLGTWVTIRKFIFAELKKKYESEGAE